MCSEKLMSVHQTQDVELDCQTLKNGFSVSECKETANPETLHSLSKDLSIGNTLPQQLKDKVFVCSSHFTADCFVHFFLNMLPFVSLPSASNIYGSITVLAISSIKTLHAVVLANVFVNEVSQSQQWEFVSVSARY